MIEVTKFRLFVTTTPYLAFAASKHYNFLLQDVDTYHNIDLASVLSYNFDEEGKNSLPLPFLLHLMIRSRHATDPTVFENHQKSLTQHCERSELRLHLSGQKFMKSAKNDPL